jgi:endonuclease-3
VGKIDDVIKRLEKKYTNTKTALKYSNPLELLVATILSAQCTDATVNKVTETLFKKYKTVDDYAMADVQEFEKQIYSTGFYKNKTKSIIGSAKMIRKKFKNKVPDNMEDLLELPGVARKTANVVLGEAFGKSEGIVVDTHVKRVAFRLGLTKNKNPEKIEQDLIKIIPKDKWIGFPFLIIKLGREVCTAKNPQHNKCVLNDICPKK